MEEEEEEADERRENEASREENIMGIISTGAQLAPGEEWRDKGRDEMQRCGWIGCDKVDKAPAVESFCATR
jgi:hypothetical protein